MGVGSEDLELPSIRVDLEWVEHQMLRSRQGDCGDRVASAPSNGRSPEGRPGDSPGGSLQIMVESMVPDRAFNSCCSDRPCLRLELRSVRNDTELDEAPQRDHELPGEGHDPHLPETRSSVGEALLVPQA